MDDYDIIEKVRKFLEEKQALDFQSCYFITKKLNEIYWEEINEEDGEEGINDDEEDDFDLPDLPQFDNKEIIKKPKVKIKEN